MHSPFPRAALVLALLCGGCHEQAPAAGAGADGALLPNYTDRGIVVVEPNPQRPNYWDFDVVAYGDRPTHTFRLRNLDPRPVTIRSVLPSCGCGFVTLRSADGQQVVRGVMTEDAPPFRLAPGAQAELELAIDTTFVERMNLDKLVTVRIVCDSENTPFLSFEAHLKVLRDFLCTPARIDLGEIPQGYGKRATGSVSTDSAGSTAAILRLARVEGPFQASVDETKVGERSTWLVVVDANEDAPFGFARGKVVLETSGSDGTGTGRPFEIPVSGQVVPRIVARPAQVRLSLVNDSATVALECLVPGEKVEIRRVRFEGAGPDFVVQLVPERPDGKRAVKWKVVLRLTEKGAGGGFTRTAVLELDDPGIPELRVPVTVDAH
jgi:hypothetical protein